MENQENVQQEKISTEELEKQEAQLNNEQLKDVGVGTKESVALGEALVTIEAVELVDIPTKKGVSKKLNCTCRHPSKEDGTITISTVKFQQGDKIKTSGLWISTDSDGLLNKGSALAVLITHAKAGNINGLVGKQIQAVPGEDGYLALKAY